MKLFAYGTLMTAEGCRRMLGDRAAGFTFRVARLPGWRRVWNVHSDFWGGGVLNVERAQGSAVVGVVIEDLTEDDLATLDRGEPTHLPREQVVVQPDWGDPVPAQLYWRRKGNHTGKPSARYLALVLERAREAGSSVFDDLSTASVDAAGVVKKFV